jgi:ornithine cyclodeaminase/alanine dehydrogenase-like protein (mu-crystallin family)
MRDMITGQGNCMKILILDHDQVYAAMPISTCIEVMSEALDSLARGRFHLPLRMIVRPPDAEGMMGLMPCYRSGERAAYALKAVCVFPRNPAFGKDSHQGAVLLFSAVTGELLAVVNASAVTAIRTAAVSAVATRALARKDASQLAVIGAGVQGRAHLAAIAEVRPIKVARVADAVPERARGFAAEMSAVHSFPVEAADNAEAAVRHADIIVTVTSSSQPVLDRAWVAEGAHINAVGACVPHAREIDSATVAASKLYVDRRESVLNESGDYLIALREGAIGPEHIRAEIGEVLTGEAQGRASDRDITLFKALGLAVEDLAAVEFLYRRSLETGSGTWVEL